MRLRFAGSSGGRRSRRTNGGSGSQSRIAFENGDILVRDAKNCLEIGRRAGLHWQPSPLAASARHRATVRKSSRLVEAISSESRALCRTDSVDCRRRHVYVAPMPLWTFECPARTWSAARAILTARPRISPRCDSASAHAKLIPSLQATTLWPPLAASA